MNADPEGWQPGDPLYTRDQHSTYVYNFRDDAHTEDCHCSDAARWPEPFGSGRDLTRTPDELTAFITDWHTWNATR